MRMLRCARWFFLALLISLIPASSYAGVFISVGFAPPVLPVYVQPPCPEPGLMWTPGYWAYGDEGYYWVPGAWVPVPYEGALWTPPYWGWSSGLYVYHPGYWGLHVGYYGGVNYGFGYMGIGFVGGEWRGHEFAYNTAVVNVNRTVIRNTYVNETIVHNTTIINNNHVAYSGGPGGIQHQPTAQEQVAMHEAHVAPTSFQQQHMQAARADHASYFNANHGHPQNVAMARPLQAQHVPPPAQNARAAMSTNGNNAGHTAPAYPSQNRQGYQPQAHPAQSYQQSRPAPQGQPQSRPEYQSRPAPSYQPQSRPEPQSRPAPSYQPQSRPEPQTRPAPRPEQQSRPAPEPRSEPRREPHR